MVGVSKLSLRMPSGKSSVRRFRISDGVVAVYAWAASLDPACNEREFDIFQAYPRRNLSEIASETIEGAGISGAALLLQWK